MRKAIYGIMIAMILLAGTPLSADPCKSRCKEIAKACKGRCKLADPQATPERHNCLQVCEIREHECRARCR